MSRALARWQTGRCGSGVGARALGSAPVVGPLVASSRPTPLPPPPTPSPAASGNCSGAGRPRPLPISLAHRLCNLENQRTWMEVIALDPHQNLLWGWGYGGLRLAWRLPQAHSPTCLPHPQV